MSPESLNRRHVISVAERAVQRPRDDVSCAPRAHNGNAALAARTCRRITVRCNCLLGDKSLGPNAVIGIVRLDPSGWKALERQIDTLAECNVVK